MKFLKEVKRELDGVIFKIGDKINSAGAGEYYISTIFKNNRYNSGTGISGYKNLERVFANLNYPEIAECGFDDLNVIQHVKTNIFLTKDQIEREGWTLDDQYDNEKNFYKGDNSLRLYIGYIKDEIVEFRISIYNAEGTLFKGNCRSLDDFIYVCELLKV